MNNSCLISDQTYTLLDRIPLGLLVLRDDFVVLFWNVCLESWTGKPRQDIVGQDVGQHYPHLKEPKYAHRFQQIFAGGPPTIFSSQLHKHLLPIPFANGKLRVQQTTVTAIPYILPRYHALIAIQDVTDITYQSLAYRQMRDRALEEVQEREQAENALKDTHQELQNWVQELEQRNQEIMLLRSLSENLLASYSLSDAYQTLSQLLPKIFPQSAGGIYIRQDHHLNPVTTWGVSETPDLTQGWCIPLKAQGMKLGIFHLDHPLASTNQELVRTVSKTIALGLANLKLRDRLQNLSIRDPLTGLYNRRYLEDTLDKELHRAQRRQNPVGFILLDVDHFKQFNDTFGHEAGDRVLQNLSQFLQNTIRRSDIACRYGGEELLLILPEANLDNTHKRAEQIRQGIKQVKIEHQGQTIGTITLSLGVACFPQHGETRDAVIRAADTALYRAKAEGRDLVICAK
ncbi:diguanylate cyclase [Spirulina sp. CS-785/01]|uniref:sensor domain-containing diguanylate cyclase n=1 Tax=Spirulina sp. CS-785/01 TaxID=3021716 RepID=UPI0023304564|nr:diguanylate cyclase [Spirulina sp. CS-785/01]MDB9311996.1 diguanylate cyclase [Spirulina sp. CS-785/01]